MALAFKKAALHLPGFYPQHRARELTEHTELRLSEALPNLCFRTPEKLQVSRNSLCFRHPEKGWTPGQLPLGEEKDLCPCFAEQAAGAGGIAAAGRVALQPGTRKGTRNTNQSTSENPQRREEPCTAPGRAAQQPAPPTVQLDADRASGAAGPPNRPSGPRHPPGDLRDTRDTRRNEQNLLFAASKKFTVLKGDGEQSLGFERLFLLGFTLQFCLISLQ